MTKISSLGGGDQSRWEPPKAILDIKGEDPYDQNSDPRGGGGGGGGNHGGEPLGPILDIRRVPHDQNFDPMGWGPFTVWTPSGHKGTLMTKVLTLGGWGPFTVGTPGGHFGHKGNPYGQNGDIKRWGPFMMGTP